MSHNNKNRGVAYLLTGPSHGVRLVVSLWSLRQHYDGPVTLYTTHPESYAIGRRCAADGRLRVDHRTMEYVNTRESATFLTKVKLLPQVPYETAVYLDADTVVAGRIDELFDVSAAEPLCATQFSNWRTNSPILRRRINAWRGIRQERYDPAWFKRLLNEALRPHPAVNSGVVGFRPEAAILSAWYELAMVGRSTFICDEIALQLLLPHYPHKLLDCRYNCSPLFGVHRCDARIWHLHGGKHVDRKEYRSVWLPFYEECLRHNVAGLPEWSPGGDRRLQRFLKTRSC